MIVRLFRVYACLSGALLACCVWGADAPHNPKPVTSKAQAPKKFVAQLSDGDLALFSKRFERELWPAMTRGKGECAHCHDGDGKIQLEIPDDNADMAFRHLLSEDRFEIKGPDGIFGRIVSKDPKRIMPPPPVKAWSSEEIAALKKFCEDVKTHERADASKMDEMFPLELLGEFTSKAPPDTNGNTFLTYFQLKHKIKTIFNDDWKRDDKDLFVENIALFGGADFVRSFNENSKASATFLSGVDQLAQDVASRAYLQSSGPFAGRHAQLPSPLGMTAPDEGYTADITRLFNRILYRNPTPEELKAAFKMIQNICSVEPQLAVQPQTLRLSLSVTDAEGLSVRRDFSVPVLNEAGGLYQEFINQNVATKDEARKTLARPFTLKAGNEIQRLMVTNSATNGNVSLAGVEIKGPLPSGTVKTVGMKDPGVKLFGAWKFVDRTPPAYEDANDNKGSSSITVPLAVAADGKYELTVLWKPNDKPQPAGDAKKGKGNKNVGGDLVNAGNVLIEVVSQDATLHAVEPPPPVPPKGEAHFTIDETVNNIPFWDLKTSFQFGDGDGVEINNTGTHRTVVADAVHFFLDPRQEGAKLTEKLTVKSSEAAGNEKWGEFKPGKFKPYNSVGPRLLSDDNNSKGALKAVFKPATHKDLWKPKEFYRVRLVVPGKAGNETQAPVIVRAQRSSPILQLNPPLRLHAGGEVTIDASHSYNLQRDKLKYEWMQTGGPRIPIADPSAPSITFKATPMSGQQAAWEGLCRALLQHPDFLFTRPPSLATLPDNPANKLARAKLQLVKLAQDLIARPPSHDELQRLEKGQPLSAFVDEYLKSAEFKDFYYHRIRLTLESHGGELEDEPARLWTYICQNDRPFKEIITADYSVDKKFQKTERPVYCGKTGVLTMKGFMDGKPGLPHFNYAAVVCEKFLGYVFEVPASIVAQREGATAASTTQTTSVCYSCHKILTPLAFQRMKWDDKGAFHDKDEKGKAIDDSDHNLVENYPFKGNGLEAFAVQAQNKERFIRTMIQTHFIFYFGREMRYEEDERGLYKKLWDTANTTNFAIKPMLRAMLTSPEYLDASPHVPKLAENH